MRFKFKCDLSRAVAHGALKSGFMAFAGVNGSCTEAELKGLEACQYPFGRQLRTRLFYRCVASWAAATRERAEVGTAGLGNTHGEQVLVGDKGPRPRVGSGLRPDEVGCA